MNEWRKEIRNMENKEEREKKEERVTDGLKK